jgi:biopolymer transport protein ExbD
MNLRKSKSEGAEVAAEAMNDIMFFLMLFFLIVATLANPNVVKLSVPNAKVKNEMSKRTDVRLTVRKNGGDVLFLIGTQQVNKESLETRLLMELKGEKDPQVIIDAADDLTVQDLVDVLSLGERLKIKMIFT